MKKKILSTLLAAAMVLTSCLPVFAEGEVQPQPTPETPAVVNEEPEEFCECGLAKDHEGECQKAAEEFCECGLAKGHEGECQKAAEELCDCGLTKGHEGECQKAAEEFCECGLAKGHEGDCQQAAEEFCDCGLAKDHEGECQKAAEEFCECGLAKDHEGECQKATEAPVVPVETPVEYCELRSNDELCSVNLTVSGRLPTDVELIAYDMPMAYGVRSTVENPFGDRLCAAMDISLWQGEEEWQPAEGEMVTVCMDAADLGLENGDGFFVYHVHEEDDGSVTEEMLGPFTVENDKAVFEMSRFSYVIILNGEVKIPGVEYYYRASGESGNGNVEALGVYYVKNNQGLLEAHLLLSEKNNKLNNVNIGKLTVNGVEIKGATMTYWGKASSLLLRDDVSETSILYGNYNNIADINLGSNFALEDSFIINIEWTTSFGFNIDDMSVTVVFDHGILKTVYSINGNQVESDQLISSVPEVKSGDTLVYKIVIANGEKSTQDVSGDISDIFPEALLTNLQITTSLDTNKWNDVTIGNGEFTIEQNVKLNRGESKTYYVKAQVVDSPEIGEYINTARFTTGQKYRESKASVEVKEPPKGDLTITKNVGGNVYDDGDTFLFTVTGPENFYMEIVLGAGQSVTIPDLPLGDYTVTENTNWSWRYKEVENTPTVITVNLMANQGNEAVFSNVQHKFYWLSGTGYGKNLWGSNTVIPSGDINKTEGGSN